MRTEFFFFVGIGGFNLKFGVCNQIFVKLVLTFFNYFYSKLKIKRLNFVFLLIHLAFESIKKIKKVTKIVYCTFLDIYIIALNVFQRNFFHRGVYWSGLI